eukprot:SAG25_NODE_2195_length_1853_cov_1.716648_2_plen_91_part_00
MGVVLPDLRLVEVGDGRGPRRSRCVARDPAPRCRGQRRPLAGEERHAQLLAPLQGLRLHRGLAPAATRGRTQYTKEQATAQAQETESVDG